MLKKLSITLALAAAVLTSACDVRLPDGCVARSQPQTGVVDFVRLNPTDRLGVWLVDLEVYGYSTQEDSVIYQTRACATKHR